MGITMDTFELIVSADGNITGGSMYPTRTIAKLFGVTDRHIQQLTKDGVLPATETPNGRQYDLVPTIQAYIRYLRDAAHGKTGDQREQELKQQKLEADLALRGTKRAAPPEAGHSRGEIHPRGRSYPGLRPVLRGL